MFDLCTWYEYLGMFILEIYVSNQNTIPNYFFYALSSRNCVLDAADIWQGALRIPKASKGFRGCRQQPPTAIVATDE